MKKIIVCAVMMFSAAISAGERLPQGTDYPVDSLYNGKTAVQVDRSHEMTNLYRTRLKAALPGEIVFAGEYARTSWGCGSGGCHIVAFISKRTGRAPDRAFMVYYDMNEEPVGDEILYADKHSRLIITAGKDEDTGQRVRSCYLLEGNDFRLLTRLPDDNLPPVQP